MKTATLTFTVLAVWATLIATSVAADFQVTTQIYRGNARIPAVTYHTVFNGTKVYDVIATPPRQATIIDYNTGKITLLDPNREVKLTMSTQDVLQHSAYFKSHGDFPDDPLWNFLRDPKFSVNYDPQTQILKLDGKPLTYESDLNKISDQALVDAYARFCDWSAQLNFICAGGDLPQARIELNHQISAKGAVPSEVRKTIRHANPAKSVSLRSTHEFQWSIQPENLKLIESIEQDIAKAKAVTLGEYVKPAFTTAQN